MGFFWGGVIVVVRRATAFSLLKDTDQIDSKQWWHYFKTAAEQVGRDISSVVDGCPIPPPPSRVPKEEARCLRGSIVGVKMQYRASVLFIPAQIL